MRQNPRSEEHTSELQSRLFAIKEIVTTRVVKRQEDLRRELHKRGLHVTQATLSRDMKDLGVTRVVTERGPKYDLQQASEAQILRPVVGTEVVSIQSHEALIVVRTLPGCANTVGEYVDLLHLTDVIGTVAGDNTLLVVPSSARHTERLMKTLRKTLIQGA